MTKFLLSAHVLAVILAIGPVTVAASMFPAVTRRVLAAPAGALAAPEAPEAPEAPDVTVLRTLHRICRVYAAVGLAVPVFGVATGASLGILGDAWLIVSAVLTAVAAVLLAIVILPRQDDILAAASKAEPLHERLPARLAMTTGVFNLLWATVTVLMIVRPGSTTGA
ncbi:hypothetical protein CC117_21820 [Parafrankia colletiae]|uniref:Integral membrane protein n=1 Tax=Parafrankia colletiae TaxID=573497 RepID=A0A1S1QJX8_9ACTN|nr:hypothetical protein [Parafrankia colletiae]MCK9899909.1 hypothetical protein [Frankia sp. Cpl3]OHV34270.1 hypothetical protein CC117_21820 [Parafrankia colletiae]